MEIIMVTKDIADETLALQQRLDNAIEKELSQNISRNNKVELESIRNRLLLKYLGIDIIGINSSDHIK